MSDDEPEIIPEEVFAAEMAADEYIPEEDEEVDKQPKKKKMKMKVNKETQKKAKENEEKENQTELTLQQPQEEANEEKAVEEIEPLIQPIQPIGPMKVPQPQEQPQLEDGYDINFLKRPQEDEEDMPKAQQINDGLIHDWGEFEKFFQYMGQPIDERQPGFPQYNNFINHPLPQQEIGEDLMKQPIPELAQQEPPPILPLFPLLERAFQKENRVPVIDPRLLREKFDDLPNNEQQAFLREIRQNFPQLIAFGKEEPNQHQNELPNMPDLFNEAVKEEEAGKEEEVVVQVIEEVQKEPSWYANMPYDDECKKQYIYCVQRGKEENEAYAELLRQKEGNKIKFNDNNDLSGLLKRALQKHNELPELKNIKKMKHGRSTDTHSKPKPYIGRANIEDLKDDELILLFKSFTFQGKVVLSLVSLKWQSILESIFERQVYLWFSNDEKNTKRYLPIEVCCETCRRHLDEEPVIRVVKNIFLLRIIDETLSMTNNLKCLRLYRFEFNEIIFVISLRKNCPQLKHLDLTECYGLTLIVIRKLTLEFKRMVHLLLSSTNLNEDMLTDIIGQMKHLETLDVSGTVVTGQSLQDLPDCLKRLDIRCCPKISAVNVINFIKKNKVWKLEHLKMDAIVNRQLYLVLSDKQESLILFEINEFTNIVLSGHEFLDPLGRMVKLQSLKIGKNVSINNALLQQIMNSCKNMRSFSLEFSDYGERPPSDADLALIGTKWPHLERLEIMNSPAAERRFANCLPLLSRLEYLNLSQCTRLYDDFFPKTVEKMNVNYLVLDKCHGLGKSTLDSVILKAKRGTNEVMRISMLRCNFKNLPYLKGKLLPENLRLTYSTLNAKIYFYFNGQRMQKGRVAQIVNLLD